MSEWQPIKVTAIQGFFGEHRFLSNFWPCQITFEGLEYPSVEHAYQAAKTLDQGLRVYIKSLPKPGQAKREGKNAQLRPDWEDVKIQIMHKLVKEKFSKNESLKAQLLATGTKYLEETNTWGDSFWGVCKGKGKNMLGHILMDVRNQLRDGTGA
jgi:N-glycosidase YbiA